MQSGVTTKLFDCFGIESVIWIIGGMRALCTRMLLVSTFTDDDAFLNF